MYEWATDDFLQTQVKKELMTPEDGDFRRKLRAAELDPVFQAILQQQARDSQATARMLCQLAEAGDPPTPPAAGPAAGILCPECGGRQWRVVKTTRRTGEIRRQRKCRSCGQILGTVERAVG